MARPRLGESDSKRLQMVITEDELKAIDEWRFANKIENRSEAIRRLCQVGIEVDSDLDEATDLIDEALKIAEAHWDEMREDVHAQAKEGNTNDPSFILLRERMGAAHSIYERLDQLHVLLISMYNRITPIIDERKISEGLNKSTEVKAKFKEIIDQMNDRIRELEENSVIVQVSQEWQKEGGREEYEALSEDEKDQFWDNVMKERLGNRTWKGKFRK
ncbi:PAS domain-containing protein [Ochrobactrum daejeonense]|uniref:PAS domain-containing protein n=1 Tax=Brucella daejeonensis TaxID=659015 RepID=A0A7W9EL96_9HYPH|nr:hypothetical protein [Brucella daejeonensis]MBB5702119.1 PAS domain-containing protein [Brucella daejeonensis]